MTRWRHSSAVVPTSDGAHAPLDRDREPGAPSRRSRRKMLVATRRGSSVLDRRARVSSHRDGRAGLRAADVPCGSVGRGVRMACAAARRISRARRTPLVDPRGTSHACPGARRARDGHARRGACDRAWCRAVHDRSRFLTLRGVADDEPARRDVIASRAPVHAQKEGIPEPARTEKLAATSAALYKERRGGDSNPRRPKPHTISSRAVSTGLTHLSVVSSSRG